MGEKSILLKIKEMSEEKIEKTREEKIEEIKKDENFSCGKYAAKYPEEFERQCIEEMLVKYIEDYNNYVVDKAIITCDQISKETVYMGYEGKKVYLKGEAGRVEKEGEKEIIISTEYFFAYPFDGEIRKLRAVHALNQAANGLSYATVADRGIQRMKDEGKLEKASIISLGNCKLLMESDIDEIEKRREKAGQYGTCYCLMKLVEEWNNPMCVEILTGNQEAKELHFERDSEIMPKQIIPEKPQCINMEHHQTMKWDTEFGKKEGLTMLSTLLCTRGGIISIEFSGQTIDHNANEEISANSIAENSKDINVKEVILKLLEMENGIELVSDYLEVIKRENPEYVEFLELLAQPESGGSYEAHKGQYLGRYQIGNSVFEQIKFKDSSGNWTELAKSLGVNSAEDFLKNETAQEVAILFSLRWDYQNILSNGNDREVGSTINGTMITNSGEIAAGHLVGCDTLRKAFAGEISWEDAYDGNHVEALVYMEKMGGLDISGILVGIE